MDPLETELKHLIVDALSLTDVSPDAIDSQAPLIGEGLGLDSIDALELAMAIGKRYSVKFNSGDTRARDAFANVRTLAKYVSQNRPAAAGAA
jgi:acyl carrier protein